MIFHIFIILLIILFIRIIKIIKYLLHRYYNNFHYNFKDGLPMITFSQVQL